MKRCVILGGGISGLTLAWYLQEYSKEPLEITLIEKSKRVGGWISTQRADGVLFEQGPRGIRPKGKGRAFLQLVEELGLQDEVIAADPSMKRRYLLHRGELKQLPTHPLAALTSPLCKGLLRALMGEWRVPKHDQEDESIYGFVSRRLSPTIAEGLIDPMTQGIYAGDIHQLSIRSCFPKLYALEQKHGSILKGMFKRKEEAIEPTTPFIQHYAKAPLLSFKRGMETLPQQLLKKLQVDLRLEEEAVSVRVDGDQVQLTTDREEYAADHLFSTLPAQATASLLSELSPTISSLCRHIDANSIAVVNLIYPQETLKRRGFGYLVPTRENETILGCVWDSAVFPQQTERSGKSVLTVMLPYKNRRTSDKYIALAREALDRHMGISEKPLVQQMRVARGAIPQYRIGHHQIVEKIEESLAGLPQLTLLGSSFYGVAVNDCIFSARENAKKFCDSSYATGFAI